MEAAQARLSLHLSKYHIVGNHVSWLICYTFRSIKPVWDGDPRLGASGFSSAEIKKELKKSSAFLVC